MEGIESDSAPEPVYSAAQLVSSPSAVQALAAEPPSEIVKGYEFEKDRYVAIDPAEIRKLARSTSRSLDVLEFVRWAEIDPAYLDASYYVVPDPSGEKAYSLLYAAMKATGFAALAQVTMHGRERIVILRDGVRGLVGHSMYYASEVRRDQEFAAGTNAFTDKEAQLASALITQMAGPFEPDRFVDEYKARVQALVEAKVQRVAPDTLSANDEVVSRKAPVDILDALKRSLQQAAARKGPQPAVRPKRRSA